MKLMILFRKDAEEFETFAGSVVRESGAPSFFYYLIQILLEPGVKVRILP